MKDCELNEIAKSCLKTIKRTLTYVLFHSILAYPFLLIPYFTAKLQDVQYVRLLSDPREGQDSSEVSDSLPQTQAWCTLVRSCLKTCIVFIRLNAALE